MKKRIENMAKKSRSRAAGVQPAQGGTPAPDRKPRFMMLALEPRFMFDAAAVATAAEGVANSSGDTGWHDTSREAVTETHAIDVAGPATQGQGAGQERSEVVFVDTRVTDYQAIIEAISPTAEVVLINTGRDGVAQIAEALANRDSVDAIHVVSHGDEGVLLLGDAPLHQGNMDRYAEMLAGIGQSLTETGDIHLWGCNVGGGDKGQGFLSALADATGADIAASSDSTGNAEGGGDWELEITTGAVTMSGAIDTARLGGYSHQLETFSVETIADLRNALATASINGEADIITFTGDIAATGIGDMLTSTTDNHETFVDIDILDGAALDIVGGGYSLDANYYGRVLEVRSGEVEISNLTIRDGLVSGDGGMGGASATSSLGAGIANHGELTLRDVTVTSNVASGGGGGGGVSAGNYGGGGGGGGGYAGKGGGAGGASGAGFYSGAPGSNGTGGDGGGYSTMGGKGGTAIGGAGSTGTNGYSNGGTGGTASNGSLSIGGGGGGSGWDTVGGAGGAAAGGIFNASGATLTVVGTSVISNNLGAGGGGGGGSGVDSNGLDGGDGGRGVGAIWNEGTVRMTATNFAVMTGNAGASGQGGMEDGAGTPGATPTAQNNVYSTGTLDTNYAENTAPAISGTASTPTVDDTATTTPFANLSFGDADGNGGTVTITYTGANGALSGAGLTGAAGHYTLSGASPAELTSRLQALVFTPTKNQAPVGDTTQTTFTLTPNDGTASGASHTATVVTATSVEDGPPASVAGTIDFNGLPTETNLGSVVTDGMGGSNDIADITYMIYATNPDGTPTGKDWVYYTDTNVGTDGIIGDQYYGDPVIVIKSADGAEFSFEGITISDYVGAQFQVTFEGFRNGVSTGSVTLPLDWSVTGLDIFTPANFPAEIFANVDEVRITNPDDVDGVPADAVTTKTNVIGIDSIVLGEPVANDAPTATNLTQTVTYTEDGGTVALGDIVVSDADSGETITATLTLSDGAAGTLSVGTFGSAVSTYNPGTGVWTVTGSVADVNAALAAVAFTPAANWAADVTITTQIRDAASTGPANGTITLDGTAVNDAPVLTAPGSITVTEDVETALTGISITDPDAGSDSITATLSVPSGVLSATSGSGVTVGGTASALTLTGTVANINAFIAANGVTYTTAANDTGTRTLTLTVTDNGNTGSGGTLSDTATVDLAITAVNDAPVLTVPGSIPMTEDTASAITGISVADVDAGSGLVVVTLSVPAGELSATSGSGVAVGGTSGALTLTGSVADINAFIADSNVAYTPAANDAGVRVLTVSINDNGNTGSGGAQGDTQTVNLNIAAVNDAPVVSTSGGSAAYIENAAPVAIDSGLTLSDLDNTSFSSATVAIVGNFIASQDALSFINDGSTMGNITGSYNSGTGVLTLTSAGGTATVAQWQAALRTVGYVNTSETPVTAGRIISFAVSDGVSTSGTATRAVSVTSVNDAPTASNLDQTKTYTEGQGTAVALDDIVVTDVDSGETVTATLTLNDPGAGSLSTGTHGSATSTFNAGTGVWMVTGSVADVNAALAAVTFTPAESHDQTVTITTHIRDAAGTGPADGTITLSATAVNDAPVVTAPASINVTEDVTTALTGISVADMDAGTGAVTVTLSIGSGALTATSGDGVTVGGTANALTLTGTLADINAFIAGGEVSYTSASNDTGSRVLSVTATDNGNTGTGGAQSDTKFVNLTITAVNDAPIVTAPGSIEVAENEPRALTGISFADVDAGSGLVVATLSVSAGSLSAASGGGVTVGGTANALTLTGSVADINAFLASEGVTYTPLMNDSGSRALTVSINDNGNSGSGGAQSATQTINLSIAAVNDAPVVSAPASVNVTEDMTTTLTGISFADAGTGALTVTFAVPAGSLSAASGGGVTVGGTANALTLTGTLADINAFIANGEVNYTPAANDTGNRTLTVTVTDNGNTGSGGAKGAAKTVELQIAAVNDAPVTGAPLPDVEWGKGDNALEIPPGAFADADGDTLSYSASLAGGAPLPSWLHFDQASRTLSGQPPIGEGQLTVVITATDGSGATATSSFGLTYVNPEVVTPPEPAPTPFVPPVPMPAPAAPVALAPAPAPAGAAPAPVVTVVRTASQPLSQAIENSSGWFAPPLSNDFPLLTTSLPMTEIAVADGPLVFALPEGLFQQVDPQAVFQLEARLADGSPLPGWLSFDPATGTFTGEPPAGTEGVTVQVIARDPNGRQATAEIQLNIARQGGGQAEAAGTARDAAEKQAQLEGGTVAVAALERAGLGKPSFSQQLALARQGGLAGNQAALMEAARAVARVTRS